jgi:hypothetical protein
MDKPRLTMNRESFLAIRPHLLVFKGNREAVNAMFKQMRERSLAFPRGYNPSPIGRAVYEAITIREPTFRGNYPAALMPDTALKDIDLLWGKLCGISKTFLHFRPEAWEADLPWQWPPQPVGGSEPAEKQNKQAREALMLAWRRALLANCVVHIGEAMAAV